MHVHFCTRYTHVCIPCARAVCTHMHHTPARDHACRKSSCETLVHCCHCHCTALLALALAGTGIAADSSLTRSSQLAIAIFTCIALCRWYQGMTNEDSAPHPTEPFSVTQQVAAMLSYWCRDFEVSSFWYPRQLHGNVCHAGPRSQGSKGRVACLMLGRENFAEALPRRHRPANRRFML